MAVRFHVSILVICWLLGPLIPTGLLLASGFVLNTDKIVKSTSQQAGWIILLILGLAALIPPFFLSYHRLNHVWAVSSHASGGWRKILFACFWYASPRHVYSEWRTRWILAVSFSIVLYAATIAFDLYIMGKQDSESVNGQKIAWNIYTTATLPTHRQAEIAALSGGKLHYPKIEHVTHDNAPVTSFNIPAYYHRAASMNLRYGGPSLGWNQ
ncbi:hypothetical protein CcaverHIS002_0401910 [Cutaneotrichosporon cavernicola]|uniref:Uncharacterized protein n=1 Tax=Cutaneotrichosporon cavernicola TaxID=279322 RepID=A0AA48QVN2_9TREE|nr:uncharacterized protein CcaverHIS019_0401870 [Cutaneotrichosporon cavernicola]BEI83587.1 hypothetical protein CcaverHIS002_0401910 [Cutaneotrichosporon cavernicola]BEI91367.1 hypothetical protein CcaverHIS019_0401870 [Cutaneotrichosporon cavernicola]BEI99140.1 hypothetical protein CcaverHIS631_0401830 [Cutaneotrichosporon cavernicola]BEJ06915.1 hypothetical protein CcaverHIS641_0401840 [Cutaneotrichosporon cavernicola]